MLQTIDPQDFNVTGFTPFIQRKIKHQLQNNLSQKDPLVRLEVAVVLMRLQIRVDLFWEGFLMKEVDAVIVGGGLGGWIAAVYAAQGGKRILLVEKSERVGGRAATVQKGDALFNMGAHTVFPKGELAGVFNDLGISIPGGAPELGGLGLWRDRIYPLPASFRTLLTYPLLSMRGKMEFARLTSTIMGMKFDENYWKDNGSNGSKAKAHPEESLAQWIERNIRDTMVRRLFLATLVRTSTYVADPHKQRARTALRQVKHVLTGGSFYVDGGWVTMVKALQAKAHSLGVTYKAGTAVVCVEPPAQKNLPSSSQTSPMSGAQEEDRNSFLVRFQDGETIRVDAVILAVPPAQCMDLVAGANKTDLASWHRQAWKVEVACLDLGLRRLPNPDVNFVMGLESPFLFTNHSRRAKVGKNGISVVHLIKYNDSAHTDTSRDKVMLERVMDILQPEWRKEVVASQFLPRMTVMEDVDRPGRMRPGPKVSQIPGLYVAGDWTGHGELLADAAAAGARRAAQAFLSDFSGPWAEGADERVGAIQRV